MNTKFLYGGVECCVARSPPEIVISSTAPSDVVAPKTNLEPLPMSNYSVNCKLVIHMRDPKAKDVRFSKTHDPVSLYRRCETQPSRSSKNIANNNEVMKLSVGAKRTSCRAKRDPRC